MIVEATALQGLPIRTVKQAKLGLAEACIFDGKRAQLLGFQVSSNPILKQFSRLDAENILEISRGQIVVDQSSALTKDLKPFDAELNRYGPIIGVRAKTESGQTLGVVRDVYLEVETGFIIRFLVRQFVAERIIPRQFLVSISPKQIVFKDIVSQPIFDQVALQQTV